MSNTIPDRIKDSFEKQAESERKRGGRVLINHVMPYVSVTLSNTDSFFFQGKEAFDLIDETPVNMRTEDFILAMAIGW